MVPQAPSFTSHSHALKETIYRSLTIHACQGMSLEKMALDLGSSSCPPAIAYVGLSRVTTLKGLYLIRFHPNSIRHDSEANVEMDRLRGHFFELPPKIPCK